MRTFHILYTFHRDDLSKRDVVLLRIKDVSGSDNPHLFDGHDCSIERTVKAQGCHLFDTVVHAGNEIEANQVVIDKFKEANK